MCVCVCVCVRVRVRVCACVCVSGPQELKETEELDIQLKVFNENKEEDAIELSHRFDDIRSEMEYPS